jgi:glycosyltransferase involved in cell wall biosynthesis
MQFVLLGDGPDAEWFRREARDLPNISFEGYVTNVGDYMSAFDLFVLPSLHEGIGGILLDAMSFGVPVIASAVDGLPEIVHDGQNGLLVPAADESRLAQAIERLYREPGTRARMGAEGRRVAADYTPAHMARRYVEVYSAVMTGQGT